ncbi:MAG: class SAM-dependent methyltransferase, partial [Acidobacteria bacterium]|nr:class SAM-dependent methyltransferase [Acidobacteriota bacterium]
DVVEHIEDEQAAARKLADLTLPGGRVVITVPAGQYLFGYHDEILGHYRRYTAKTLRRLFEPFVTIERLRYFGLLLIPVAFVLSRVARRPYPTATVGLAADRNRIVGAIMRTFFGWEKRLSPPLGTSVMLLGIRRSG